MSDPPVESDPYPVQYVGIEHTGPRHGREGQGDDDLVDAGAVGGGKAEES
jgi:hypothetical protein